MASADDQETDADRGPGLGKRSLMGHRRRFRLRGVMEVEPRIVEPAGTERSQPVMAGGDRRAELDLLDAQGRQPLLARPAARSRGRTR